MKHKPTATFPAAKLLIRAFKRSAKLDRKMHSPTHALSWHLDVRGRFFGFDNWALFHHHITTLVPAQLHELTAKAESLSALAHFGQKESEVDEATAIEAMRDFVRRKFMPLIDFAPVDRESSTGYAWPGADLGWELWDQFTAQFADELIERVASALEAESGPWGLENYGRDEGE